MSVDSVNRYLNEFAGWADAQPDIQAVALVGSYARNAATKTSDIDLVIIANQPETYLQDVAWTRRFGQVRRQQVEDYGKVTSIRVWYTDGREVEYGITNESWAALPLDEGTHRVISDGMRVLFEREPILSRHQLQTARREKRGSHMEDLLSQGPLCIRELQAFHESLDREKAFDLKRNLTRTWHKKPNPAKEC